MGALNTLSAVEAARQIAAGKLTSEALVRDCLDRIAVRESEVLAWAYFDPDAAIRQARAADAAPPRGLLHGVPVGVKDLIDTIDMPTEYGSPVYAGHRPAWDAPCVALTRAAGGIVLGKTVTTEFANMHPNKTRNPHDPAHTLRLGGGRRRLHGAAGVRHANRGIHHPALVLLRRRRL
jgi:Asp-tRNA(Asn)/Glu-tRNA(Gln) amidotransferase A subunit family amidase